MRALLFDTYHQQITEIILPAATAVFHQQVKQHLHTERVDTIHPINRLSILFDPLAFAQPGTPGFLLGIMKEFPLFGNVICVGRNTTTYQIEELGEEFTRDYFEVNWFDAAEAEEWRKKSMQIGIENFRS